MQYRVLKHLSTGPRKGDVIDESELAKYAIEPLIRVNAISPVAYPPLDALPGWIRRSELCGELGITDIGEFLEADTEYLAEQLNFQPRTIKKWKKEAASAVNVTGQKATDRGCQGCGQ